MVHAFIMTCSHCNIAILQLCRGEHSATHMPAPGGKQRTGSQFEDLASSRYHGEGQAL